MTKKIIIISIIALFLSSCYIDDNSNNTEEKTVLSISLPIPEEAMKAPSGYYFEVYLYPAVGDEIFREVDLGSFDPYDDGGGGVFPVVLTDIPEGLYTDLDISFYYAGDIQYLDNSTYPFTITKGENTVVNVVIGPFF